MAPGATGEGPERDDGAGNRLEGPSALRALAGELAEDPVRAALVGAGTAQAWREDGKAWRDRARSEGTERIFIPASRPAGTAAGWEPCASCARRPTWPSGRASWTARTRQGSGSVRGAASLTGPWPRSPSFPAGGTRNSRGLARGRPERLGNWVRGVRVRDEVTEEPAAARHFLALGDLSIMKPSKYRSTSQNAAMAKIAPAALKKRLSRAARANGAGRKEVNHAFPSRPPAILTGRPAFGGAPPMDTEAFRKPPRPKNWSGVV